MTNEKLKALIENELKANNVRNDAAIDYTQHGNGYSVCVQVPHTRLDSGWTEYSLPLCFAVYGIQTEDRIKSIIRDFFRSYKHLVNK